MRCSQCCIRLNDPDEFCEGRRFVRGSSLSSPYDDIPKERGVCRGYSRGLAPVACAAAEASNVRPRKTTRAVFSGDTRPGKAANAETEDRPSQGHKSFVGEKPRNIIADGMQRFTSNKTAPLQPDWIRLADNVVSVLGQNPGFAQLNGTNCYIVGTGRKRILIDAGEAGSADKFISSFQKVMKEIECEGLQEILVTHLHHDHYGCIRQLQEIYGPNIPVGKLPSSDVVFQSMENLKQQDIVKYLEDENGSPRFKGGWSADGQLVGLPAEEEIDWGGKGTEWDRHRRSKRQIIMHYPYMKESYQFYKEDLGNMYPFHELSHDEVIVTEGATLRVVYTPGHSEDHAAFFLKEGNALFSGDTVLGFGTTIVQDMFSYVRSLHTMYALGPTTLFPGHGPCIDDGTDYLQRYISHRTARIEQVYATLVQNGGSRAVMTAREIADVLYTKTSEALKQQAVQNCVQNLTALVKEGRAHAYEYNANGALQVLDLSNVGFNGPPSSTVFGLSMTRAKI